MCLSKQTRDKRTHAIAVGYTIICMRIAPRCMSMCAYRLFYIERNGRVCARYDITRCVFCVDVMRDDDVNNNTRTRHCRFDDVPGSASRVIAITPVSIVSNTHPISARNRRNTTARRVQLAQCRARCRMRRVRRDARAEASICRVINKL